MILNNPIIQYFFFGLKVYVPSMQLGSNLSITVEISRAQTDADDHNISPV